MPEAIDFSPDFVKPSLLGELRGDISVAEKADALARLGHLAEANRRGLQKQTRQFQKMYAEASQRLPGEGLVMLAERIRESEAGARELLYPWMEALRQAISVPSEQCWLPLEVVIEHNRLEAEATGEPHHLRDRGLLESALARPRPAALAEPDRPEIVPQLTAIPCCELRDRG